MAGKMPIISITGPRQSGKTTLSKMCFPDYDYVNLESPETRRAAEEDPKAFLQTHKKGLIIDEAQRMPDLFSYLQVVSDEKGKTGEYILTGSQNFLLKQTISQSLAGRVFVSHLLPFSLHELRQAELLPENPNDAILKGFYPRLYDKDIEPALFYPSYNQTYLERDIAGLVSATNINAFRKFMELLAGRTGQLINFSALSIEVGVDYKTIQSWCSLLETGFMVFFLRPFHKNYSKRLVKNPKIYFYDTGLACTLLGIKSADDVANHWARGALFENMIVADCMKGFYNAGQRPPVYFWRDSKGLEVDLLIEESSGIKVVEIKSGTTINTDFFSSLERFEKIADSPLSKYILYGGNSGTVRRDTTVLPWFEVAKVVG
jgi:predicted AAA+ superfamily ATPase